MKALLSIVWGFAVISAINAQGSILLQPSPYSEIPGGQTVRFTCVGYSTGGSAPPTISWQGPDGPIPSDASVPGVNVYAEMQSVDSTNFRVSVLELCNVDVTQSGTYSCTASGGTGSVGSSSASFEVVVLGQVKVAGSIVVYPPEAQDVNYLDNVELICMAYGDPLPSITWSIPECDDISSDCDSTSTINITDSVITYGSVQFRKSVLQFCSIQEQDTNEYTCWADNGISAPGIASNNRSIDLIVVKASVTTTMKPTPAVTMPTTPPTTPPTTTTPPTAPPATTPPTAPPTTTSTTEDVGRPRVTSTTEAEPSSRPQTESSAQSYQILLIIEGIIVAALLAAIIGTTVAIFVTTPNKSKHTTDNFGYNTWKPGATDRDPGLGAQNPLADDPGNETLEDDFNSPDIGALIEEVEDGKVPLN